jgi:hypothetical protein
LKDRYTLPLPSVRRVFLDRTFRGQFLLIDQGWGVIGRNVLNFLSLLFDGPSQTWQQPTLG